MKTFYFTNPTDDRHKAKEIRKQIEKAVNIQLLNPFYDHVGNPTKEIAALDKGKPVSVSDSEIVHSDLKMIRDSDGVIAYITNKSSWGSIQECFVAHYMFGKTVYIIFDPKTQSKCEQCGIKNPNNPKHPWAKANSTRVFGNLEGFIAYAKEKYGEKADQSSIIETT